jgi:hypothetical protein
MPYVSSPAKRPYNRCRIDRHDKEYLASSLPPGNNDNNAERPRDQCLAGLSVPGRSLSDFRSAFVVMLRLPRRGLLGSLRRGHYTEPELPITSHYLVALTRLLKSLLYP